MFLAAFGVALAVTFFQVSREIDSVVRFNVVDVRSSADLGLYTDEEPTKPAEFLNYPACWTYSRPWDQPGRLGPEDSLS